MKDVSATSYCWLLRRSICIVQGKTGDSQGGKCHPVPLPFCPQSPQMPHWGISVQTGPHAPRRDLGAPWESCWVFTPHEASNEGYCQCTPGPGLLRAVQRGKRRWTLPWTLQPPERQLSRPRACGESGLPPHPTRSGS